jgi:hypothetical protein
MRTILLISLALIVSASAALAQDAPGDGFHRFHAAALIGESHEGARNGITFGADLEVRLARRVGVGITGEHVNEPFRENVWVAPLVIHPSHGLRIMVGPGLERATRDEAPHGFEQHLLLRGGIGYDFALRHGWTLDPDVAVDFVDGQRVLVYAVAIGKEFGAHHHAGGGSDR